MKYEEVIAEQMKQRQAVYYGNQYKKVDSGSNGHKSKIEDVPTTKRKELAKIAGTSEGSIQRSKLILEKGTPVKAICYLAKRIKERGINMTFGKWKEIRKINGEDAKKVIRNFELNNPGLAASYEKRHEKRII